MPIPSHLIRWTTACLSLLLLAAGCSTSNSRASAALVEYQSAEAANNLYAARQALLKLVGAKDDVPDYWSELGKVEAQMGAYNDAYYAFTRAYELNRSDPELLRSLVELALRSGDVSVAQTHARELEVVAPGDPWVKLADGWAAFAQSRFDEAIAAADAMLATTPYDPAAKVLKARSLVGLQREDDALILLNEQVKAQPSDVASLMLLAKIYDRRFDWPKVLDAERRIATLAPEDRDNGILMVEAALRSGAIGEARQASFRLLQPDADPEVISAVLDRWWNYWPSPQRVADARMLAGRASGVERKLIYAAFLSRAGSPGDALRIAGPSATLPVKAENAEANAVVADALSRSGNITAAKTRLDAVIAFDPGNATALRSRAELELRTGDKGAAIADAQKLVSVLPQSPADRLLLAKAYSASGNSEWAQRTLWSAFQEIPGDENIFAALRSSRNGNSEAMNELQAEFERQRNAKLNRGLL
jgi:predicted Zn-dependent protease